MDERKMLLRRKIDLLRHCLHEGVELGIAATYLREIAEAEWELKNHPSPTDPEHC